MAELQGLLAVTMRTVLQGAARFANELFVGLACADEKILNSA
jgi:hypothetical protein